MPPIVDRIILFIFSLTLCGFAEAQSFVENKGQWDERVRYKLALDVANVYLEDARLTFDLSNPEEQALLAAAHTMQEVDYPSVLHRHAYHVSLVNANAESLKMGGDFISDRTNYFLGDDQERWASNVSSYGRVTYKEVYSGIDMELYLVDGDFKYDLILDAGADPAQIALAYDGVTPFVDELGHLVIETSVNTAIEQEPYAYQWIDGLQKEISCSYRFDGQLTFVLGEYDPTLPLTIDPVLKFSTYSGSTADNWGFCATFDKNGFLYGGGISFGTGYPTTTGAYDDSFSGGNIDIGISKYDTTGTFMVYSTYIGGSADELPHSIIVNDLDELYIYGTTGSSDFPTTLGAFDGTFNGGSGFNLLNNFNGIQFINGVDIFVSRLSADGDQLLSSTFVGGSGNDGLNRADDTKFNYADDMRGEIELDDDGNVYVASCTQRNGVTNNFPITAGVIQLADAGPSQQDAVIFKMEPDLSDMVWSTYFGGNGADAAFALTFNSLGEVIVCGGTSSSNLPTTFGVYQEAFQGGTTDGFVLKLNSTATAIEELSYLGSTSYDQTYLVETDNSDNVHLFGQTENGNAFIINAGYSSANSGQFVTKMTPDLNDIIWSTAFGSGSGTPDISPTAFLVDLCNRMYLSGWGGPAGNTQPTVNATLSTNGLEVTPDAMQSTTDGQDFYLFVLEDDASALVYASFYGGAQSGEHVDGGTSRFDRKGKIYQSVCAGCGSNDDFPISPTNAHSPTNNSTNCNNGVFKLDFELPGIIADFQAQAICLPDSLPFNNTSEGGVSFEWIFGDGEISSEYEPTHLYDEAGTYDVTLIVNDPMSCNLSDTISFPVFISQSQDFFLDTIGFCEGNSGPIGFDPIPQPGIAYSWNNGGLLDNSNISNPNATLSETTTFELTIDNGVCISIAQQTITVEQIAFALSNDTLICAGQPVTLTSTSFGTSSQFEWSTDSDFSVIIDTDSTYTFTPDISTTLYANTGIVCKEGGQVTITLSTDQLSFSQNQFVCADEDVFLSVSNLFPGVPLTSIDWSPDVAIISGDGTEQIQISTSIDRWFTADVINEYGCPLRDSILVEVSDLSFITVNAFADTLSIPLGGSTMIYADPDLGFTYQWTPPTGLSSPNSPNSIASPTSTTTYTINVIDDDLNGSCIRTDTLTLKVFEFACGFPVAFLPNSFTPNNDGVNDELYVRGQYVDTVHLAIYDRWGEKVFETFDKNIPWDGTYKGRELDPAVYVFHLTLTCLDGQRNFEKGNITLIR